MGSDVDSPAHNNQSTNHVFALFFIILALVLGVYTNWCLSNFHSKFPAFPVIPYTVALFVEGIIIYAVHSASSNGLGVFSRSIDMWVHIDPHLLLNIFLPSLLFGDVIFINWTAFRNTLGQCFILACPGVIIGTCLTALVAKIVLATYDFSWNECFALGALLGATDPVAVLSILKEVSAPLGLRLQITGEALLNDGTAIVFWSFFMMALDGEKKTVGESALFFCRLIFGAVAVGVLIGVLLVKGLSMLSNTLITENSIVQSALTIVTAYASFSVAEGIFEVSGVLSVFACGLVVARWGLPLFNNLHSAHHIWELIEFLGNTVLFLLAGLIFGERLLDTTIADVGLVIVLWFLSLIIRLTMVVVLSPFLRRSHNGLSIQEALVIVWAGLRGAVGIAMVLAMRHSVEPKKWKNMVFLTSGMAMLTLILQATTIKKLLFTLGMLENTDQEQLRLVQLEFSLQNYMHHIFMKLTSESPFDVVSQVDLVGRIATLRRRDFILKNSLICIICKWSTLHLQALFHLWLMYTRDRSFMKKKHGQCFKLQFIAKNSLSQAAVVVIAESIAESRISPVQPRQSITMNNDRRSVIPFSSNQLNALVQPGPSAGNRKRMPSCVMAIPEGDEDASSEEGAPISASKKLRMRATLKMPLVSVSLTASRVADSDRVERMSVVLFDDMMSMDGGTKSQLNDPAFVVSTDVVSERKLFLSILKAEYWSMRKEGMLPDRCESAHILLDSVDFAETKVEQSLTDWDFVEDKLCGLTHVTKFQKFIRRITGLVGFNSFNAKFCPIKCQDGSVFDCYAFLCFIDAHHATVETLANRQTFGPISEARKQVLKESSRTLRCSEIWFNHLLLTEGTVSNARLKQLVLKLLTIQRGKVLSWLNLGMINNLQAKELLTSTVEDLNNLFSSRNFING